MNSVERQRGEVEGLESLESFLKRNNVRNSDVVASKLKNLDITLSQLLGYREKEIEEICTEAEIGIISKAEVCRVIRNTLGSFAYKETRKKRFTLKKRAILQPLILPSNEQEKINQMFEKHQQTNQLINRMEEAIIALDSKKRQIQGQINTNVENLIFGIRKFQQTFLQTLDKNVERKKNVISKNLQDLKQKDTNMDEWNEQVKKIMTKPNINIQECQKEIIQHLQRHQALINWKIDPNYFVFDTNISILCDIGAVLKSVDAHIKIIENCITLQKATVMKEDISTVIIKWDDNLDRTWKNKCIFDVEFKSTEKLEENEEKNIEWKRVQVIRQNNEENVLQISHPSWKQSSNNYHLRVRARYDDVFECTPYSNVLPIFIPVPIFASSILTPLEDHMLQLYLPKKNQSKITLLYRASRDGFAASTFHGLCDHQRSTVTIINSNRHNHVFGGFTNIPWSSIKGFKKDSESFLFLLRASSQSILIPRKWNSKCEQERYAVYHHEEYGPTFGYGYDVVLYDNCNTYTKNYSKFGITYDGSNSRDILAGADTFSVKDYEVYKVE